MMKKVTMILVAMMLFVSIAKSQKDNKSNIIEFNNNVISIAIYMNQSLTDVTDELSFLSAHAELNKDSLIVVDYKCAEHTIRLWFSHNDYAEKLTGCRIIYENNKQFKSIVKIFNEKLYRTYDSKYCWGFYSNKYSYFVLIDINKKEKVIKFYLQ